MRTLAHVSDLHFGKHDPKVVEGLLRALYAAEPDIIVVSGDLTQRAKSKQFRLAREFLDAMPRVPRLVVPGNHDVSTTNLFERVVRPLTRYRRYIAPDTSPFWSDAELAIAGINTVRLLSPKDGRINRSQVERACDLFAATEGQVKVVVTHHPIDVPAEDLEHPVLTRAAMAMQRFAACGVDLFLSGHLHVGLNLTSTARYPGYSAVVVHAGTAVSTRTRKESNGWNLIRVAKNAIDVERMVWGGKGFVWGGTERYAGSDQGWVASS